MKQHLKDKILKLLQNPEAVIVLIKQQDKEPQAFLDGDYVQLLEHCWNTRLMAKELHR